MTHSKQAKIAVKSHSNSSRGTGMEHGANSRSSGGGSRRTQKELQRNNFGDDGLKAHPPRPGSISPNTQKSLDAMKRVPSLGMSLGKMDIRSNHSRGSTKSATPNLSPTSSSLTASCSSGSLGQEVEEVGVATEEVAVSPVVEDEGNEGGGNRVLSQDSRGSGGMTEVPVVSDSQVTVEQEGQQKLFPTDTNGHVLNPQQVPASYSKPAGVDSYVATPTTSCVPIDVGSSVTEGSSPPMSSPPGLSKSRTQPLPLSAQSELVCRQLDLGSHPPPLLMANHNLVAAGFVPPPQLVSRDSLQNVEQSGNVGGAGLVSRGVSEQIIMGGGGGGSGLERAEDIRSSEQLRQMSVDGKDGVRSNDQLVRTGLDGRGDIQSSDQMSLDSSGTGMDGRGGIRSSEQLRQMGLDGGLDGRGGIKSSEQLRQIGNSEVDSRGGVRSSEQLDTRSSSNDGATGMVRSSEHMGHINSSAGRSGVLGSEQLGHLGSEGMRYPRRVGGTGLVANSSISNDGKR